MRFRTTFSLVLLALCCASLLVACDDSPESAAVLALSVAPSEGGLTMTVEDKRPGEHTVWVVVRDVDGERLQDFVAFNPGTEGSSEVRGDMPLEPGTYTYSVYDIDGVRDSGHTALETSEHEVDAGEFEVL